MSDIQPESKSQWRRMSSQLVARIDYYQACSRLWKRAAKEYRGFYQIAMSTAKSNQLKWHEAERTATRCKELLESIARDIEENINPYMESAGLHPITQTLDAIEEELGDDE